MTITPSRTPVIKKLPPTADGLAIASFILSVLWLGGVGSLIAVVFAHVSNANASRAGRADSGLAVAGLILGYLGLLLLVVVVAALVQAHSAPDPTQQFINCENAQVQSIPLPPYCN